MKAVDAVVGPGAGLDHGGMAHDDDEIALPARFQAQDAEAVLLVVERVRSTRLARFSVDRPDSEVCAGVMLTTDTVP